MKKTLFLVFGFIVICMTSASGNDLGDRLISQDYHERQQALMELPALTSNQRQELASDLSQELASSNLVAAGWASEALGRLGPDAVSAVASSLRANPVNNPLAISTLSRLDLNAVPTVIEFIRTGDPQMKQNALYVIAHIRVDSLSPAINDIAGLLRDSNEDIRVQSAEELGRMARLSSWLRSRLGSVVPDLTNALADDSSRVRDAAVIALGEIRQYADQASSKLLEGVSDHQKPLRKELVIGALRQMDTSSAWTALNSMGVEKSANEEFESREPHLRHGRGGVGHHGMWRAPDK